MTKLIVALLIAGLKFSKIPIANGKNEKFFNHDVNSTLTARSMSFVENDLLYLSELPLEKLLLVERSLNELRETCYKSKCEDSSEADDSFSKSRMMVDETPYRPPIQKKMIALEDAKKINRKTGYGAVEDPWDSKPSKVQTFFQISITALAFLAFAGYLLCMIVQAIKTKGTMYMYPNSLNMVNGANTMNSIVSSGSVPLIRKRRPLGRRKRNIPLPENTQNTTNFDLENENFESIDAAEMYIVMIRCAEDYTKYYFIE